MAIDGTYQFSLILPRRERRQGRKTRLPAARLRSPLGHAGAAEAFVELGAGRDKGGLVVRYCGFARFHDPQGADRIREAAIEFRQRTSCLIWHVSQGAGTDQIEPVEPKIGSGFDRFPEPGDRLLILPGKKKRASDGPVKRADRRVMRAQSDGLLDQRRRLRRAPDEDQFIALIGVRAGKIAIELDRSANSLQRGMMLAAGAQNKAMSL